jgi:predicted ATP-dependent serine protease
LVDFTLQGVPIVKRFVERPSEIAKLEASLLPQKRKDRRKVFVLHGLGGIGKTQLAVNFARSHQQRFSAVFWLDGRSEESLKQSIANSAYRIPQGQIPETSRQYSNGCDSPIEQVIRDVTDWLRKSDNTEWLLIVDNVNHDVERRRSGGTQAVDNQAYDVTQYLPGADHGSILTTTRLAKLE